MAKRKTKKTNYLSVNRLNYMLSRGEVSCSDLRKMYSKLRKRAMSRVKTIEKSNMPFAEGAKPYFTKLSDITTESAFVREMSYLTKWLESPRSTMAGRREVQRKAINTLHSHGLMWVDESNYIDFVNFMRWFNATEYAAEYDSNADIVEDMVVYAQYAGYEGLEELFKEFKASHFYTKGGSRDKRRWK